MTRHIASYSDSIPNYFLKQVLDIHSWLIFITNYDNYKDTVDRTRSMCNSCIEWCRHNDTSMRTSVCISLYPSLCVRKNYIMQCSLLCTNIITCLHSPNQWICLDCSYLCTTCLCDHGSTTYQLLYSRMLDVVIYICLIGLHCMLF